jgi:predicted AlkP superfamily pyrophosphatase or phosphodiesterase
MARSGRVILLLLAALILSPAEARQTVLLVSIDGFRADYLDRAVTPTLSALTLFWPEFEAEILGIRPDHWLAYDKKMADADRVARLLSWLDAPADQRPNFLTLYFDKVDTAGHHEGPDSASVNEALASVDQSITQLIAGLKQRGLSETIDLITVADHGMTALCPDRMIYIDDFIAPDSVHIVTSGPMMGIDPPIGAKSVIEQALLSPKAHMTCRRKQDMPERFHTR